jgi:hypothetical protein
MGVPRTLDLAIYRLEEWFYEILFDIDSEERLTESLTSLSPKFLKTLLDLDSEQQLQSAIDHQIHAEVMLAEIQTAEAAKTAKALARYFPTVELEILDTSVEVLDELYARHLLPIRIAQP